MREVRGVNWQDLSFAAVFVATTVAFVWTVGPFLVPLLIAAAVVSLLAPFHERLAHLLGDRRHLSSVLAAIAVLLVLLVPLGLVGFYLVKQAVTLFTQWSTLLREGGLDALLAEGLGERLRPLLSRLDALGLTETLRSTLEQAASYLSSQLGTLAGTVASLVIKSFILVIGMYYFFLDGPELVEELIAFAPLEPRHTREVLIQLRATLRALFVASFVTAGIQGILGAIAFGIAGLPNAILWAALMAVLGLIFSLFPVIGTGLVYIPAAIWLMANGKVAGGIFVLLWGTLVLGSVEFFVKPYFAKERVHLHPLAIFLTLFGGIVMLGPIGVIAGPVSVSLVASFGKVWRRDIVPQLATYHP